MHVLLILDLLVYYHHNFFLFEIFQNPHQKDKNQFLVGFSAESGDSIRNFMSKMKNKNIDMTVANDISRKDIGMMSDFNEVSIIKQDGSIKRLNKDKKRIISRGIWDEIVKSVKKKDTG